jgi:hypothetical protein
MRSKTLQVKLDTAATPPVTVVQDTMPVGKHRYELNWVPATGESGWVFTAITQTDQVTALPDPPFSSPTITNSQITVTDDNKDPDEHGTYSYSICVTANGTAYWSDPEILNRGGN